MSETLRYALFAAAVPPLFLLPGFAWLRRAGVEPMLAVYAGLAATAGAAGAVVGVAQLLPWDVRTTCLAGLGLMLLTAGACLVTAPRPVLPERGDLAGVAVLLACFVAAAAFVGVPSRPHGNWKPHTSGPEQVHTPRWPGQPKDNFFPYRTGQLALHKLGGAEGRERFPGIWWVSDRTPLSGLSFAFAAGALGVDVPARDPDLRPRSEVRMTTADRHGFYAYQLVAMLLNLAAILGVFAFARVWFGRRVAIAASLVAAALPGLFLSGIYTWPKQALAYFVLVAAACAYRRRPVLAGGVVGLGWLVHPAMLWWVPSVAVLLLAVPRPLLVGQRARHRWRPLVAYMATAAALAVPWVAFTSGVMHASTRLLTWPLGATMPDPTDLAGSLSRTWEQFIDRGLLSALWIRMESTAGSLFPLDLGRNPSGLPGGGTYTDNVVLLWNNAHGFSIWGITGLVLFVAAIASLSRRWPRERLLVVGFVLPALVLAWLANGFIYPFATQSMFPLVGLLAIQAAIALLSVSTPVRRALLACMAIEFLSVAYGALYRPFGIDLAPGIGLTAFAVGGHLALLVALARAVREGRSPRSSGPGGGRRGARRDRSETDRRPPADPDPARPRGREPVVYPGEPA